MSRSWFAPIVCDKVTALTASQAITAALFARDRGGGGQHVQLSMLDAAIAFHWCDMMWNHSFLECDDAGQSDEAAEIVRTPDLADMFRISNTFDGRVVICSGSDSEFHGVCRAFGREDMIDDPRYATLQSRMQHIAELIAWQTAEVAKRTTDEVCALLDEHQVPCAKVNRLPELSDDPQVQHNGSIRRVRHPVGGEMLQAQPPVDFSATPSSKASRPAPSLGEHNLEILRDIGIDQTRVLELEGKGVLG